jgi:ABC-2 type transport system permease protein
LGVGVLGLVYGSVADSIEEFVEDNEAMNDFLTSAGVGSVTDAFLGTTLLILALIGSGYAVQSALRLRSEETSLRAEPVLVAGVSRRAWTSSHLALALAGSVIVVAAGGLGVGVAYGIIGGDLGQIPRLLGASLVFVPAMWLLVAMTVALFGVAPRAVAVAWAALGVCFVIGFLGEVLDLPHWLRLVSPFEHAPSIPGGDLTVLPLAITTLAAAALVAVGAAGIQRRDIA